MPDDQEPPEDAIVSLRNHLNTETGYAVELRVAGKAIQSSARVDRTRYYADPRTKEMRETDVVASWTSRAMPDGVWAQVFLVIECKASPKSPWVVIDDGVELNDADAKFQASIVLSSEFQADEVGVPNVTGRLSIGRLYNVPDTLFGSSIHGDKIVTGHRGNKETNDPAWAAVRAAVSASEGVAADLNVSDPGSFRAVRLLVIPVVVTSGQLYRAFLDHEGLIDVQPIDRGEVYLRVATAPEIRRVLVVTEDAVPDLFLQARKSADLLRDAEVVG